MFGPHFRTQYALLCVRLCRYRSLWVLVGSTLAQLLYVLIQQKKRYRTKHQIVRTG